MQVNTTTTVCLLTAFTPDLLTPSLLFFLVLCAPLTPASRRPHLCVSPGSYPRTLHHTAWHDMAWHDMTGSGGGAAVDERGRQVAAHLPGQPCLRKQGPPTEPRQAEVCMEFFSSFFFVHGDPGDVPTSFRGCKDFARSSRHAFRPLLSILQQSRNRGKLYTCFRAF